MRADYFFHDLPTNTLQNTVIFLDIDGTLVSDGTSQIDHAAIHTLNCLRENNDVYLCTNGRDDARNALIETATGLQVINGGLRKPSKKILGRIPGPVTKQLVVIGDKYLTDGIFARRLGAEFIKVKRLRGDELFSIKASYVLDDLSAFFMPYIALIRPWQWAKNLLVIAPVFFAGAAFQVHELFLAVIAAITFSLASSSMYVFNDMCDVEKDRQHPSKRHRPLASGLIGMNAGGILSVTLLLLSVVGMYIAPPITPVIVLYVFLTMLYSFKLKHIVVLDLICVAAFYVMRIIAGGAATGIFISQWIILCVLFGSLFVIVGKRRAEFQRNIRRTVLESYSKEALDHMLIGSAALAVMTYGIWSVVEHDSRYLVYSTVFVIFALFRLLNRIHTDPQAAEAPETLVFKDPWILSSFLLWVVYVFFVFYLA